MTMEERMVSVIVCTYNQERTIGRTLDSILMQECTLPVEIVIGEDCSSDGTLDVCRRYEARFPGRIRILANTANKGIVDNYYDCLLACRGMYIADCAGDDRWTDPKKLEKEVAVLDSNPDVGIVHTDWQFFNEATCETTPSPKAAHTGGIEDGTAYMEGILIQTSRPAIHLCTSMYRAGWAKEAHDRYPEYFRNKAYPCEDLQLAFFLAQRGKVAYLPDITLDYSWGGETISNSASHERLFDFYRRATQLSVDLTDRFRLRTPNTGYFIRQRIHALLMHAFRSGNAELRNEAIRLPEAWGCERDLPTRLITCMTGTALTWRAALMLRKAVMAAKRCRRVLRHA